MRRAKDARNVSASIKTWGRKGGLIYSAHLPLESAKAEETWVRRKLENEKCQTPFFAFYRSHELARSTSSYPYLSDTIANASYDPH